MVNKNTQNCVFLGMVEETGFEPTASWSRTKRATKLRYSSIKYSILYNIIKENAISQLVLYKLTCKNYYE